MNQGGVSAIADLSLPGNSLTSVTAWRYWHWYPHNDGDSTSLDAGRDFHQSNEQRQFSQELRIASEGERRIDYVAGVYYLWQEIKANAVNAYGTRAADRFLAPTVDRVVGAAALNNYSYVSDSSPITNSYAAFTQGIWHITPMLDLTGGLRYTYEEKRGYFNQTASGADLSTLTTAQQAAAQAIRAPYGIANSYTARGRVSGQAMLTYKVTPDASPAQDTAVQKWKLHLPIAYDNASPAPPSPDVGHHIENDRLNLAVAEVAFENARSAAEFFARSAFIRCLVSRAAISMRSVPILSLASTRSSAMVCRPRLAFAGAGPS